MTETYRSLKDWFWESNGVDRSRMACCSLKRCRDQMIAAGRSKFWKIKPKKESSYIRIESKLAQIDLELRDPRSLETSKRLIF